MVRAIVETGLAVVVLFALITGGLVRLSRVRVARAWATVETAIDARASVAGRLARAVGAFTGDGPEVAGLIDDAAATAGAPVEERESVEQRLVATLRRLFALVTQYPELQGDPTYRDLQGQLEQAQHRVESSLAAYAPSAQRLNRRVAARALRPAAAVMRCAPAPAFDPGDPVARR
jgi:hypothetical protein